MSSAMVGVRSHPCGHRDKGRKFAGEDTTRLVCVTSAASYVGLAIVRRLVKRGHPVRALVESHEDIEKLEEAMAEVATSNIHIVIVDKTYLESMIIMFEGCSAVFHTSAYIDTFGVSGYTKHMAELETTVTEAVVEACARTKSVRKCILTSSLLACVWRRDIVGSDASEQSGLENSIVDERCWSDESFCRERKLWFALGKTMMEKAAWRAAAKGKNIKLITLCPGLTTRLGFQQNKSPSTSMAYLKRGREMYAKKMLAIVDVEKVAEAHVLVYEVSESSGRYICFDGVVEDRDEVVKLEKIFGLPIHTLVGGSGASMEMVGGDGLMKLSNDKLSRLKMTSSRSYGCYPNRCLS